ncbi:hydroxyphenylacetyl-CoA thioesterase PaaI [Azospirillum sp. TSO22-1]|uniref:hydroxyphenylacetyl-CoA thioesterase PaaI n=1 Tax=Azospirillum sp. TSO22-1 TaxID=716789 RepID=UPI000D61C93B|nr:hydroxyphenylacetyl-CoA thioesterase PaaI [Azospirillum sp. TSO22-1]PWC45911.1 phenylacetic acid degradation protein [Azospirillum sp. TSO22-1]
MADHGRHSPQEVAAAVGRGMYERDYCAHAHGIELLEIAPGYARMSMTVRKDMVNGHHTCHGGMTFTLADTAFAYACNANNEATVAASCHISYPAPGRLGDTLTAECREVHRKGRNGVYDCIVTNQDGATVGIFRGMSATVKGAVVALPE